MNVVFVLGSHVRHVGAGVRSGVRCEWVPLCRQRRTNKGGRPDASYDWQVASTPAQHGRPVCSHCIREAAKIIEAVL